jgi:23S rRNA (uridine2552-2'-O)-methyltransferase
VTGRGGGGGSRGRTVRVKTARGRKPSSTRWLARQLNDPFVARARAAGYRSRAAFKLIELDDRLHLLRPGKTVVDLGAAPGGWAQVAVARVHAPGEGRVVAVDINEFDPVPGAEAAILDLRDADAIRRLAALLNGKADVVLSDMGAPATGHRATDHLRSMALCEAAFEAACEVLAPGGALVMKALQGGAEAALLAQLKQRFAQVRHVKPPASRAESREIYVVATGFR